ncbi:MAG: DUF4442 domain-containing protein [Calditrichaeota bacterium]|nr:DUF4442 domain-containing protein [Calditrichota bacterium]
MLNYVRSLLKKSQHSAFNLWLLNRVFRFSIPFNSAHKLRISKVEPELIETVAPNKRRNKNHINGMHACCIATISEFAAGVSFLNRLDPSKYRFILSDLNIHYSYQGKTACRAVAKLSNQDLEEKIMKPLSESDAVLYEQTSEVFDGNDQLIATCKTTWQIKDWSKVKTKL